MSSGISGQQLKTILAVIGILGTLIGAVLAFASVRAMAMEAKVQSDKNAIDIDALADSLKGIEIKLASIDTKVQSNVETTREIKTDVAKVNDKIDALRTGR
jgi:hypothetical protein